MLDRFVDAFTTSGVWRPPNVKYILIVSHVFPTFYIVNGSDSRRRNHVRIFEPGELNWTELSFGNIHSMSSIFSLNSYTTAKQCKKHICINYVRFFSSSFCCGWRVVSRVFLQCVNQMTPFQLVGQMRAKRSRFKNQTKVNKKKRYSELVNCECCVNTVFFFFFFFLFVVFRRILRALLLI